jgi:hypothetical protein
MLPNNFNDIEFFARYAMAVEDHPLDYADFEGVIPEREHRGGTVMGSMGRMSLKMAQTWRCFRGKGN